MDSLPYQIQINIFKKIKNPNKHLISKHFRTISILSMSSKECRSRMTFNLLNIEFLILLSQNPKCHERKIKYCHKKGKMILVMSCFEMFVDRLVLYSTIHLIKFKTNYFNEIIEKCYIPSNICNEMIKICCLYGYKDFVLKLLDKVTEFNYAFAIAYDHKYFDIAEILYEYVDFGFDEEEKVEFKRIFIEKDFENINLKIFDNPIMVYYAYSLYNYKVVSKIFGLFSAESILYTEIINDVYNNFDHNFNNYYGQLERCWKNKHIKSLFSYLSYNDSFVEKILMYEEIEWFNILVNIKSATYFESLIKSIMYRNDKYLYREIIKIKKFENFWTKVSSSLEYVILEIWDALVTNKNILHRIYYLSHHFNDIIDEINLRKNGETKEFILDITKYIKELKK